MGPDPGLGSSGTRRVAVAVTHAPMRAMIIELLDRDRNRWAAIAVPDPTNLPEAITDGSVDLVVVDGADFPACCCELLAFPLDHVVVIGTEPDPGYEAAALHDGAGAWLPRDRVGEDLSAALRDVLGRAP